MDQLTGLDLAIEEGHVPVAMYLGPSPRYARFPMVRPVRYWARGVTPLRFTVLALCQRTLVPGTR